MFSTPFLSVFCATLLAALHIKRNRWNGLHVKRDFDVSYWKRKETKPQPASTVMMRFTDR